MDVRQLRRLITTLVELVIACISGAEDLFDSDHQHPFLDALSLTKTYKNLLSCITWPVLYENHTVKCMFHADGKRMRRIKFDRPERALTLEMSDHNGVDTQGISNLIPELMSFVSSHQDKKNWKPHTDNIPYDSHVLIFETVLVKFYVGEALVPRKGTSKDETGIFAINNERGETVGELMTTYHAAESSQKYREFITISWGLSISYAEIDEKWVPRWKYDGNAVHSSMSADAERTEKAKWGAWVLNFGSGAMWDHPKLNSILQIVEKVSPGRWLSMTDRQTAEPHDAVAGLFDQLNTAKKGAPMMRSLWPVVNVMLVEWDGIIARRVGVGKIVIDAWHKQASTPIEIMLG
jgi:hypothetical protein